MPRKKRKQTVADCGSSKDTVFRRVAAFLPLLVPVRQAKEACGEPQVSFWDAITGRVPASPEDIVLSPEREFVVGGQHTGDRNPLRHWVLDEGGVPRRIRESPLGSVFDGYFETFPVGLQVELIEDKDGIHAERWVTESHRDAVGKGSPVLAGNSGKVAEHLDAAIEKVTELTTTPARATREFKSQLATAGGCHTVRARKPFISELFLLRSWFCDR